MCRKQTKKKDDWLTGKQKQKEIAEEHRRVENEHQQNQLVQLIKQEAQSVKQINIIDRVNRLCWLVYESDFCREAVVQGWRGGGKPSHLAPMPATCLSRHVSCQSQGQHLSVLAFD